MFYYNYIFTAGFQTICVRLILMLVMELTDNSLIICRELGLSGFVAHVLGIVKQFTIRGTLITKVQYIYLMWVGALREAACALCRHFLMQ